MQSDFRDLYPSPEGLGFTSLWINSLERAFIFEGFEATRRFNDPKDPKRGFTDQNKIGLISNPKAFGVLFEYRYSPWISFWKELFPAWDTPRLKKYANQFAREGLKKDLIHDIKRGAQDDPLFSQEKAIELFRQKSEPIGLSDKLLNKFKNKVTQFHSYYKNRELQNVAADLSLLLALDSKIGFVRDGHIRRVRYAMDQYGQSSFIDSQEGRVFTVSSIQPGPKKQYICGVDMQVFDRELKSIFLL